jgi:phosphoglycolate phosphatase
MTSIQKEGAIVFDFDGTLVDSFPIALDIFYSLTHTDALNDKDMMRLRGMSLLEVAKELRIPGYAVPFLVLRGRRVMRRRMNEVHIIAGMEQVIRELDKTYKLFILSSNSPKNIEAMLARYKLDECFVGVHGNVPLLGKARALRQLLRQFELNPDRTWYVGDEARDIEAAHKNKIKTVAVSWGYNNIHVLKEHDPELLVFTVEELLSCFKNNS